MRRRGDDGFTAVESTVGIAVLLLPAAIMALSIAGWAQRTSMARTMVQESARAIVLSESVHRGEVTVYVEVPMSAIVVPFIGEVGGFQWSTTHTERIDDYRSFP